MQYAFITSFDERGALARSESDGWPEETKWCELYAFAQRDVEYLCQQVGIDPSEAAGPVEMLSAMYRMEESAVAKVSTIIDSRLCRFGAKCIGVATYIPDLVSVTPTKRARGIEAFRFLCKLMRSLESLGHPSRFIEMICGSVIDELYLHAEESANGSDKVTIRASVYSVPKVMERLQEALLEILGGDESSFALPYLSLELEPGLSFALNNLDGIMAILRSINDESGVSRRIGVNLDIAHWIIAGCHSSSIMDRLSNVDRDLLLSHIVHAHVSGHHPRAHFGDFPLRAARKDFQLHAIEMARWLSAEHAADRTPMFSGFLSVEHELGGDPRLVDDSIAWLREHL